MKITADKLGLRKVRPPYADQPSSLESFLGARALRARQGYVDIQRTPHDQFHRLYQ
jgi:hypothetical protein